MSDAFGNVDWKGFRIAEVDGGKKLYQVVQGQQHELPFPTGYEGKAVGYYCVNFGFIGEIAEDITAEHMEPQALTEATHDMIRNNPHMPMMHNRGRR